MPHADQFVAKAPRKKGKSLNLKQRDKSPITKPNKEKPKEKTSLQSSTEVELPKDCSKDIPTISVAEEPLCSDSETPTEGSEEIKDTSSDSKLSPPLNDEKNESSSKKKKKTANTALREEERNNLTKSDGNVPSSRSDGKLKKKSSYRKNVADRDKSRWGSLGKKKPSRKNSVSPAPIDKVRRIAPVRPKSYTTLETTSSVPPSVNTAANSQGPVRPLTNAPVKSEPVPKEVMKEKETEVETEDAAAPVVWKRGAEAEAIRLMILKKMTQQEEEDKRETIEVEQIERKEEPEPEPEPKPKRMRKSKNIKKKGKEFCIERNDEEPGQLDVLNQLQLEFNKFAEDDNPDGGPKTSRIQKRTKIVLEIQNSEKSYLNMLVTISVEYCQPMMKKVAASPSLYDNIDLKHIFSNIEDIRLIHTKFSEILGEVISNWGEQSTVGDSFMQLSSKLKTYIFYSSNFSFSLETLKECTKNPAFVELVQSCCQSSTTKLNLESLLIAPIQRIPRYKLLLNDLLKNTPLDHPDFPFLEKAIVELGIAADNINKASSQGKYKSCFEEILNNGGEALKRRGRSMVCNAVIKCEVKRKNISLYVFNDLFIHILETKVKNKAVLTNSIHHWPMYLIWIEEMEEFTTIIGPTETYKFKSADITDWLPHLKDAVTGHIISRKDFPEPITLTSKNRYGFFEFFDPCASFTGKWESGMIKSGEYVHGNNIYTGEFSSGNKNGQGKQVNCFQYEYNGLWANNRPGGNGVLLDGSGNSYKGDFDNGMKHGQGTMNFSTGETYEGSWERDSPQGVGSMTYPNGNVYSGNWKLGMYQHYGVLTSEKFKYEGMWNNGLREGRGRMMSPETIYDGLWKADLYEGSGILEDYRGKYEGDWICGNKEGKGTMTFASGHTYKGFWKRNLFHGQGQFTYASGATKSYEGEWQSGTQNGKGIIRFHNGDSYEGFFKNNMMHGSGVYTFNNGCTVDGKWKEGFLEGKVLYTRDSKVHHASCKDSLLSLERLPPIEFHTHVRINAWL